MIRTRSPNTDNPSGRGEQSSFAAPEVWLFAVLLCLMYTGMLHDFRSAGMTQSEIQEQIVENSDAVEEDATSTPLERRAAFVLSGLIAVYCLATRKSDPCSGSPLLLMLVAMSIGITFASLFWSESRAGTAVNLVRVGAYSALALGLAIRFTPLELAKIISLSAAMSVAVSFFAGMVGFGPSEGEGVLRLAGTVHPNVAARFATLAILGLLPFLWKSDRLSWSAAALVLALCGVVMLTRSRTSLACLLAGVFAYYSIEMTWRTRIAYASVGVCVLGAFLLLAGVTGGKMLSEAGAVANMGRSDDSESLNGRLPLWEELLHMSQGKYLQGFGYGVFWSEKRNAKLLHELHWAPGHAHNVFLEVMVQVGVIGALAVAAVGWVTLIRLGRLSIATGGLGYRVLFAMMVSIIASSFTTTAFIQPRDMGLLAGAIVLAAAVAPRAQVWSAQRWVTPVRPDNGLAYAGGAT